jgi:hypothetical protein
MLALGALLVACGTTSTGQPGGGGDHPASATSSTGRSAADTGIFQFHGANEVAKEALVNWGIAALVYLLVGRLLARVVRP